MRDSHPAEELGATVKKGPRSRAADLERQPDLDSLLGLLRRLLSKEQRRFIKFCLVGASGVPVNLLCTWLGHRVLFASLDEGARKATAYLLGILISILTNFLLNDLWTWKDRQAARSHFLGRLLRFYLVCSAASLIQWGVAMALSV